MRYLNRGGSRGNRRGRRKRLHEDEDPLSAVANLFDVAMIFALGLMVMVLMQMGMQEALTDPEQMKEIIERGKVMQKSQELVTVPGELIESESGKLCVIEQPDGTTLTLWVNESVEGQG